MWEILVAKEPVFISEFIFSFCEECDDIFSEWTNDFYPVIQQIREHEYGVIIIKKLGELYLLYIDKSCFPNLCGHASFGLSHLLYKNYNYNNTLHFNTKSGKIISKIEENTIILTMPVSRIIELNLIINLPFIKSSSIVECGNSFILIEVKNINNYSVDYLRELSIGLINQHNVYGVFWYSFLDILSTRSITVFGKNGQIDLSPCGTGSSSLAALLYAKKILSLGEKLENYSLSNDKFTVEIKENNSIQPSLYSSNNIEIIKKHKFNIPVTNKNWQLINLADYKL